MDELIDVTDVCGRVMRPEWLAASESVHRQLRQFREPYTDAMERVFAGGGRMRVAVRGAAVAGLAVWRAFEKTDAGLQMYVDDLVTDERRRSSGVGSTLLRSLIDTARALGCAMFELDSGTHRKRAHAFYFRERMEITAFHFVLRVGEGGGSPERPSGR
jgi:GNAT superfamily N-acetyltransferase